MIIRTRHCTFCAIHNLGAVSEDDATVTLLSVLNSSKGITSILASEETFLNSQVTCTELILAPSKSTAIRTKIGVASLLEDQ